MQTFLSPLDNVPANPGCECCSLVLDGGFDNNAIIHNAPEIDIETCDLLHVVMSTDYPFAA